MSERGHASIAIVGAGIAGLTAALRLRDAGADVTVFESRGRPGGAIHSERANGFLFEHGPNSVQAKTPLLEEVIAAAGALDARIEAAPSAKNRYVVRGGKPVALPGSPKAFLTTRLFSVAAKIRLLREPFTSPGDPDADESLADFVRRRLGREFLDYAINPFVAGVFAGDPEHLSVRHAFPKLFALEQQYGSLIKGQIRKARERKGLGTPGPDHRMFSFVDGMGTLPAALAGVLGPRVRLNTPVKAITTNGVRWLVTAGDGADMAFDAVLLTAPLFTLDRLRITPSADVAPLLDVSYPPVTVVVTGFRREQVTHPLDGFGMLVPEVEREIRILGTLFSSTLFPGRAPDGHVLLTTFVGGARRPELTRLESVDLEKIVLEDLRHLLGVQGQPVFSRQIRWERAIPQYDVGYGHVTAHLERLEASHRGLFFAGNFRRGISVSDALTSGHEVAQQVMSFVSTR